MTTNKAIEAMKHLNAAIETLRSTQNEIANEIADELMNGEEYSKILELMNDKR